MSVVIEQTPNPNALKFVVSREVRGNKSPLFYKKDISLLARNGFDFETSKKVMEIEKDDFIKIVKLL